MKFPYLFPNQQFEEFWANLKPMTARSGQVSFNLLIILNYIISMELIIVCEITQ